jgi:hypothetical protein
MSRWSPAYVPEIETGRHIKSNACTVEIKIKWMIRKHMTYENTSVTICSASIQSTCTFEFKIVMKLLSSRAWQHTLWLQCFLNFQQEFVNYWFIYRIFGCDWKTIRTYCDTTVTLTGRYPFFISLYKTLHRKRMDAQHCGVLVKTYNIFKMQKLMFIKTQNIF